MWKVKTNWRNRLANEQLDHNLRISEGVPITKWYNKKVEINFKVAKLRKYPEKQQFSNTPANTAAYMFSDFEESDDNEDDNVEETET